MGQAFEEKDLRELIAEVDTDGKALYGTGVPDVMMTLFHAAHSCVCRFGEIEFDEFLTLVSRFVVEGDKAKMEQELREAFRLYDKQGNGYINVSDLREILRALDDNITEEELDEMIAEIDTDGSGTVDFDGKLHHHATSSILFCGLW